MRTNMANTVTQIKRLIGRKYSEPGVQEEMKEHLNFNIVQTENDEIGIEVSSRDATRLPLSLCVASPVAHLQPIPRPPHPQSLSPPPQVDYNDETRVFSPVAVLGAFFTKMKGIIQGANPAVTTPSVVVSVPAYFTEAQRQAVRDAAAVAGLACLRTLNEGTAAVIAYGLPKSAKKEFPEGSEAKVLFLDMGHGHFTATLAAFTNDALRVVASASDDGIGGREFDLAIAKHFAGEFKAKCGKDAWGSRKARVKLMVAAEKAKIAITPYGVNQTPVSVECLFEDVDFSTRFTLETLEELTAPLMERMGATIKRALQAGGVSSPSELAAVELVGGGMRPRPIKRQAAVSLGMPLNEETGHGLSSSMNLDEAVARGCALACAALVPTFRMKPIDVADVVPHALRINWEAPKGADAGALPFGSPSESAMDVEDGSAASSTDAATSMVIFHWNEATNGKTGSLVRRVTYRRSEPFTITAEYDPSAEPGEAALGTPLYAGHPRALGKYIIGGFPAPGSDSSVSSEPGSSKVRVDFKHDASGVTTLLRAELLRELLPEPVAAPAPAPEGAAESDAAATPAEPAAAPAAAAPKKKFKRTDLTVTALAPSFGAPLPSSAPLGMAPADMSAAQAAERAMAASDAEIHATQDMRNSLEAFIYRYRDDVSESGVLGRFVDAPTRDALQAQLDATESWLYDNFEADKGTYAGKLGALQAAVGPVASRKSESERRYEAVGVLSKTIDDYRSALDNASGRHGHLTETDRDTLRAAVSEADAWLKASQAAQSGREIYQDPAYTVAEVGAWVDRLRKECGPIASKPVPAPAPAPAPAAAPATAAAAAMETEEPAPAPAAEGAAPAAEAAPESATAKMEVD